MRGKRKGQDVVVTCGVITTASETHSCFLALGSPTPPISERRVLLRALGPWLASHGMALLSPPTGLTPCCSLVHPLAQVPREMVAQSCTSYAEADIHAPTLEDLGSQLEGSGATFHTYLDHLVQGLQKEAKEKFRGWVTCSSTDNTDLAFKKVIAGVGKHDPQRATFDHREFVLL